MPDDLMANRESGDDLRDMMRSLSFDECVHCAGTGFDDQANWTCAACEGAGMIAIWEDAG